MELRNKITFLFSITVALIIFLSSLAIYISFSQSRKEEFYDRLSQKAQLVAQMLIDIDEIDKELLRKIELNNPLSLPNEKIKIYDYRNKLLYVSDTLNNFEYSIDLINEVRLEREVHLKRGKAEIVGRFYTGQYDRIVVFVAATDIFGVNKLKRLRIILLIVFVSSLCIVYISGRFFASRALKPVTGLMREVDKIEAADLSVRLNTGNDQDEIARLARTFNRFLNRLESAVNMQKNFIANASHELRTPLTVLTGQLEVLLLKKRKTAEYEKTLVSTLEEIKNLSIISNRLLLLAQASSHMSHTGFVPCRIDDLLWQARNELIKRHEEYDIQLGFDSDIDSEEKLTVNGNGLLLKTAFLNLLDNGCKYSNPPSCLANIKLDGPNRILILFEDKGMGIPTSELKNIFQPFYRSKNAIELKGHGIGLSLVEKIITLHKGKVTVKSEVGKGTTFTLQLNLIV